MRTLALVAVGVIVGIVLGLMFVYLLFLEFERGFNG